MVRVYKKLTRRTRIWVLLGALWSACGRCHRRAALDPHSIGNAEGARHRAAHRRARERSDDRDARRARLPARVGQRQGVVIRQKGRTDVPPLITIDEFEIRGSLRDLMQHPRHVSEVRLRGLEVKISPGDDDDDDAETRRRSRRPRPRQQTRNLQRVIIDRFEAPDTVITLIPKRAGKQPKVFTVHHLVMDSLGVNQTIPYIATLTNPVPKGEIETSGTFGPWNVAHPARTPVTGKVRVREREPRHHQRARRRAELDGRVPRSAQSHRGAGNDRHAEVPGGRGRPACAAENPFHRHRRWV